MHAVQEPITWVFSCASFITLTGSRSPFSTLCADLSANCSLYSAGSTPSSAHPPTPSNTPNAPFRFRTKHASSPPLSALSGCGTRIAPALTTSNLVSASAGDASVVARTGRVAPTRRAPARHTFASRETLLPRLTHPPARAPRVVIARTAISLARMRHARSQSNQIKSNRIESNRCAIRSMSSPSRRPGSDTRPARATRAVRPLSVCRARRPPARGSLERRAIMLRGPPARAPGFEIFPRSVVCTPIKPVHPLRERG